MNHQLEEKLAEEFAFMRRGKNYEEQTAEGMVSDLYGAWGCAHGDGWYDLIHGMCSEISEAYHKRGLQINLVVNQVKEKWGTLRFYYHFDDCPQTVNAIDFVGVGSMRFEPEGTELQKEIASIVRNYEAKSATVCEFCGAPGSLRRGRRISTLCEECWDKLNKQREEAAERKKEWRLD